MSTTPRKMRKDITFLGGASVTGPSTINGGTADFTGTVNVIKVGTVAAALTNGIVGTANGGRVVIGNNGATIQLGFVHNGSVFIFSALAGTGAVTSAVGA